MMLAVVRATVQGINQEALCRIFDPSTPPLPPKTMLACREARKFQSSTPHQLNTFATLSWGAGERRSERKCFLIHSPNRRQNLLFILVHSVWRNKFGNTYVIHVAIAIAASSHNSSIRLSAIFSARTPPSDGPVSPAAPPTRGNNHPQHEKEVCIIRKL